MIGFARRHPAVTTLGLGVFVVIAGGVYRSALGGGLILLWCALVVFFAVRWLRRRFGSQNPQNTQKPQEVLLAPPQAPYVPTYAPTVQVPTAFAAPTLGDVLMLTATQFEELCRDLLTACGFQGMTRTGGAGDLGADVKGRDRQGRSVIVQAKRYAPGNQVGSPVLQSFIGMMTVQHKAERGVFVTSGLCSQPAKDLARAHGVTLIDGPTLLTLMALTGVGPQSRSTLMLTTPSFLAAGATARVGVTLPSYNGDQPSWGNVGPRAAKFCTNCGDAAGEGVAFCANCGQKIKRLSV